MAHARFSNEEIARRGEALYQQMRPQVEAGNKGKYLVLDVETGDYEIGNDYLALIQQLRAKHADAALYTLRIGSPTAGRIGGKLTVATS